jgi:hypothetical protein
MFNLNTLGKLMKVSIYLNRKLIFWLSLSFSLLFIFTTDGGLLSSPLYMIALFVGGCLISSSAFKELQDPSSNILYLTLPTSALMRYISVWLLTGPLYFLLITLLYSIGMIAHFFSNHFWGFNDLFSLIGIAEQYLMVNAFFLCGAVCFKKLPLIKTLLCLLVLGITLAIFRNWSLKAGFIFMNSDIVKDMLWLFLGVLAWLMAFRQLTKTELK